MFAANTQSLSKSTIWRMNNLAPATENQNNIQDSQVLQVIKIYDNTAENANPILLLSDGVYYDKFLFYANAKSQLEESSLKENDIIKCKIIPAKNKALVVIAFELVYNDVAAQIGEPVFIAETTQAVEDANINVDIKRLGQKMTLAPRALGGVPIQLSDKVNRDSNSDDNYTPISMMNVYSYDFTIKARLIKKSVLREYKQAKGGQGSLFSIELMDGSDAPKNVVKGTFFNESAVKYFAEMDEGKVYVINGGEIKPKNQKFNTTHHQVEIIFGRQTSITEVDEGKCKIAKEKYNFELINMIEKYQKYHPMDVMVIVQKIGDSEEINLRNGGQMTKKNVEVYDESGACVNLTLWGKVKGDENLVENSIIAVKNVSVNEFRGKCLSSTKETEIKIDFPDTLDRYKSLLSFHTDGKQVHSIGQQNFEGQERKVRYLKALADIQEDALNKFDRCDEDERKRPFYYNTMGLVTYIPKGTMYYNACPVDKCSKKLVEGNNGKWSCEKCGGSFAQPKAKFIGNVKISDHTTSLFATVNSDKVGEKVYGKTAEWVRNACEGESMTDTETLFEDLKNMTMIEYYFTIMVKQEYWRR